MSDIDLKAYLFGEMPDEERRRVAVYLEKDPAARAELARLEQTQALLGLVQDEELPRRIAFVSDKVFEPTWWQRFLASGPQLGFASAALLALAIVSHGWMSRPVAALPVVAGQGAQGNLKELVALEVSQRMSEVARPAASALNDDRTAKMIAVAIQGIERKTQFDRAADRLMIEDNFKLLQRLMSRDQLASYQRPAGER